MNSHVPRLRMVAGPNGSGKSTIREELPPWLFRTFIDPDALEQEIRRDNSFDFSRFRLNPDPEDIFRFFQESTLMARADLTQEARQIEMRDSRLDFSGVQMNSYYASVLSDFIRRRLVARGASFCFETVMSSPDKVDFVDWAQSCGYRTYLYYIATMAPELNVSRVRNRVGEGGHDVPHDKIISRYHRSLALLPAAIAASDRAYIFDNSGSQSVCIAEIIGGQDLALKTDAPPAWFRRAYLDTL